MTNGTREPSISKKTLDSLKRIGYICIHRAWALSEKVGKMAKSTNQREGRMIHIRLPNDLHKRLRIRVAEDETTMQNFIATLLERALKPKKR